MLFADPALLEPANNLGFLRQCVEHFPEINVAEQSAGRIYLRIASGRIQWEDRELLEQGILERDARVALAAIAPGVGDAAMAEPRGSKYLKDLHPGQPITTLGRWGKGA